MVPSTWYVLVLLAFGIGKNFLIHQVGFGHADHELDNMFLLCQVGFGSINRVLGDTFLLNLVELDQLAYDLDIFAP